MSAARNTPPPDEPAGQSPRDRNQFAGEAPRDAASGEPSRRLSADSLARAFENARRAFSGRQRKRSAEPKEAAPLGTEPSLGFEPEAPHAPAEHELLGELAANYESEEFKLDEPTIVSSLPEPEVPGYEPASFDPAAWADENSPEPQPADGELTPLGLVESMLFVGDASGLPLTSERMAGLLRGVEPAEVDGLVEQLNRGYATNGCPYEIITTGGGYRLVLRAEFDKLRDRFFGRTRAARLSQAAIEVLAAVAYNQPLTAEQVSNLRGTPSGPILAQLVRRQLLRVERTDTKPRVTTYSTTPRFLTLFGLQSVDDLPRSEEVNQR